MDSRASRGMIKLMALIVFLGYCLIWIMSPTNTYRQDWLSKIVANTSSTYFGDQGGTILIYTFPILFIATLGCAYLHLGKKLNRYILESGKKNCTLARWKQPVLVKGPLGMVSAIELTFFIMFIALLVWSFSTDLLNTFAEIPSESLLEEHGVKMWEAKLDIAASRMGIVGNICLAFLFFPVARGSSILPLFGGLTSESSIKYHKWLGHIVMVLFTSHGLSYITLWAATNEISEMVKWDKIEVSNVAGEIALVAGLFMWVTTIPRIRRKMFELFYCTHHLYIVFMVFFMLHVGIAFASMMLPGLYLFLIDRYLRFLQSKRNVRLVSARILPCEALELNFSKDSGLTYNPTSIAFVNVPSISKLQWHPFTITSNSNLESEKLSVIIKSEGLWTQKLYEMLSSPSSVEHVNVAFEGPYGPDSCHFLRHDTLVMVSGGSGITPFVSIIRELIYASSNSIKTPKLLLISSFKNSTDLTMLNLLLPISSTSSTDITKLDIQIEAYVTRENEPMTGSDRNKQPPRDVWFKSKSSDAPISAILGQNNWLWLAMIISSSFVMYLTSMGLLTRYYIYPIDQGSNEIYALSSRTLLHLLLICSSIAVTASGAFLWNKRRNGKESKQVNVTNESFPDGRELESFPQQSIFQAINFHYGTRPDLKQILFGCKEQNVGVLVCGPKQMRNEVATICSSGLADNLHFESISFSW